MRDQLTNQQVWDEIEKNLFAVLGFVTAQNEGRTVGIVYTVQDRKLYISTGTDTWKTRYCAQNPHVSLTIPIHKSIPLMPWIKIPAATITFSGLAAVSPAKDASPDLLQALFQGFESDLQMITETSIIEVTPERDFITYGIGIPLMSMREPEKARGRVSVGG